LKQIDGNANPEKYWSRSAVTKDWKCWLEPSDIARDGAVF
jgi:hypothetical protein